MIINNRMSLKYSVYKKECLTPQTMNRTIKGPLFLLCFYTNTSSTDYDILYTHGAIPSCHPVKINKNNNITLLLDNKRGYNTYTYIHRTFVRRTISSKLPSQTIIIQSQKKCHNNNNNTHNKLTFFTNRFICLLPLHHVTVAGAGLEPELLHSTSYVLSADTNFSFVKI